jgi:hypothetical protein
LQKILDTTQLAAVERSFAHVPKSRIRVFATGSGAAPLIEPLGAKPADLEKRFGVIP